MKTKKLFSYFLAITLMMGTFCALPAQAATNSINFDEQGYDFNVDSWEITEGTDAVISGAVDGVNAHSDEKMLKVTNDADTDAAELKVSLGATPGTNYVVSVWMYLTGFEDDIADETDGVKLRVTDGTEAGNLMSRVWGSAKTPIPEQTSETEYFVVSKSCWRKMYVYVHGEGVVNPAVDMILSFKGAGTVYFDDILIEEAPLIPNGDFEGLKSDFEPAVWVNEGVTLANNAATINDATFTDRDAIPEYTEDNKTAYPWKGYNYTFLGTEEGKEGQHLAIAQEKTGIQIFPIELEAGKKYKLTMDYQAVHLAKSARLQVNHKLASDENPFMRGNKITSVTSSANYSRLPDGNGQWVTGFEYYFIAYPMATANKGKDLYIALSNHEVPNMLKVDNVRLEKLEDVPTVSITQDGEPVESNFEGGGTALVSFTDAYAPLLDPVMSQADTTSNTAYIYRGTEEATMLVAAYTMENGVKKLVECKVVAGKAESSTLLFDTTKVPTPDITAHPTSDSKWCHGEVPLELETEITFGEEGDDKEYELEAFILGDNLKPMYTKSELIYN